MQDLNFTPFTKTSSLVRSPSRPGRNESLLRANRASLAHLGPGCEVTTDPKGKVLRQLRLNAGLDPSELATRACISLAQLYEIEQGTSTCFYSTSLREQAAKRVARLLGTDWNHLATTQSDSPPNNNVVHLQRPGGNKVTSLAASSRAGQGLTEQEKPDALPLQPEPPPLGLSTPCASTVQPEQDQTAEKEQPSTRSRGASVMFWVFLIMLGSAATVFALNEWSPYRLMWPWETAFPWRLPLLFSS